MSKVPSDLKFTNDHEWLRLEEDGSMRIGITDHAQSALGDVTFVDLPGPGDQFSAGDSFGVVESVKAVSDLYMPVDGEILEVNEGVADGPEAVNQDPYGDGWLVRIKPDESASTDNLLSPSDYEVLLAAEG